MCGIFGCVFPGNVPPETLSRMGAALVHRGPDEGGEFLERNVGIGIKRLSIVDILRGHQPYESEDKKQIAVFNGEIYNYRDLRAQFPDYPFKTQSDGEVLLPLYRKYGEAFVHHLQGMFAIALFDGSSQKLLLVRDRMGKKPLYHYESDGNFFFASEIKSIFAALQKTISFDPIAVDQYFTFGYPVAPRTLYKGVCELLPASVLTLQEGNAHTYRYWSPHFVPESEKESRGELELAGELHSLLERATKDRLIGEAPLACYLSGGIDSTIVVSSLKKQLRDGAHSYSLSFPGERFDDGEYCDLAARHIYDEKEFPVFYHSFAAQDSIAEEYPKAVFHLERPMRFSVPLLFFLLARKVHEHGIKVILSGEGADEVLAGYECFRMALGHANDLGDAYSWHPQSDRFSAPSPFVAQDHPYAKGFGFMPARIHEWLLLEPYKEQFYSFGLKRSLKRERPGREIFSAIDPEVAADLHPLDKNLYLEMMTRLPHEILMTGDRMSMAHGVEVRMPFLDNRVVDFCTKLPSSWKINGGTEKYILRKSFEDKIPRSIAHRPKKPFYGKMREWFFGSEAPEWVNECLSPKRVSGLGLFNPQVVSHYRKALAHPQLPFYQSFAYEAALMGIMGFQALDEFGKTRYDS